MGVIIIVGAKGLQISLAEQMAYLCGETIGIDLRGRQKRV